MFGIANLRQLSLTVVTYAAGMRFFVLFACLLLNACDHRIYARHGVTDGDTFFLAPAALANDDPAFQSWVAYSLMKSACQLRIGGENPARASSFECEFTARRHLIDAWEERPAENRAAADLYLDLLGEIRQANFLAEYTAYYFGRRHWQLPDGIRADEFRRWRRQHLRGHRPETRITGSWNFGAAGAGAPDE